ncbi:MAG TPA: OmpH family outer membrane protein [Allosphingosinicella sp.]|nr:OmpH family outer membrane protein [Allosphingosinicella sp.]
MNKFAFGAALAALAAVIPTAAPAQKVGGAIIAVVNTDRVYKECTACKAAQAQLQTQGNSLQQFAQQLAQPIQTEGQSIEAAVRALNGKPADAALQARITAWQTKQNAANQQFQTRQQTLQSTQQHVLQQINVRLRPILTQVMNARGANVLIDAGNTLDNSPSLDVTNDVLAALNQQLTSVSVTPLPQAAGQQQQQQPQGR